jgi:hypothetical protein
VTATDTTDAIAVELEQALRGLWAVAITVERAARGSVGTRQEAMVCLAGTLHEAIGQLTALATVG